LLGRLFRLFAASLVPGGGYFVAGWSPATALALYWVDNVIGGLAMAIRIAEHQRLTGLAGHTRAQLGAVVTTSDGSSEKTVKFRSFLAEFLVVSTMFSVGHGLFLAAILGFVLEPPDVDALRQGAVAIALCHAIALTVDRFAIANWPFARLKDQAERLMGRLTLVNIALIGGTWIMAFSDSRDSFFSVFIWLKALSDISAMMPAYEPREAPGWLVRVMSLFPKQKGETFEEYWRRTRQSEEDQAALDERARKK
jgi:hypothetical protein